MTIPSSPTQPDSASTAPSGKWLPAGLLWYLFLAFLFANAFKMAATYFFLNISLAYCLFHFTTAFLLGSIVFSLALQFQKPYAAIMLYLLQGVYVAIHLSYFLIYWDYLHINELYLFRETMDVVRHFSVPLNIRILVLFADLPILVFLLIHYRSWRGVVIKSAAFGRLPRLISVALLLAILYLSYVTQPNDLRPDSGLVDLTLIGRYGLAAHDINDLLKSSEETKDVNHIDYGQRWSVGNRSPQKSNVITIQVESLDANIVNDKVLGEYVMPFLSGLANRAIYYPFTLSYHEAGGSSDCEISVINSIEPLKSYPFISIEDYSYPNSFVKRLSQTAYGTFAFHGNSGTFYNRKNAYKRMGFKDFFDIDRMRLKEAGWGVPDEMVLNYVLARLEKQKPPFYYHVITMSSHEPFENVDHYYQNHRYDGIKEEQSRRYLRSLSYVDQVLKAFVLRVRQINPDTYIFIYGDHTPFTINDGFYSRCAFRREGKSFEFVPLLIITPDEKRYTEKREAASFVDLAPTILSAAGISFEYRSDGKNLLLPDTTGGKIVYEGEKYDRDWLFRNAEVTGVSRSLPSHNPIN